MIFFSKKKTDPQIFSSQNPWKSFSSQKYFQCFQDFSGYWNRLKTRTRTHQIDLELRNHSNVIKVYLIMMIRLSKNGAENFKACGSAILKVLRWDFPVICLNSNINFHNLLLLGANSMLKEFVEVEVMKRNVGIERIDDRLGYQSHWIRQVIPLKYNHQQDGAITKPRHCNYMLLAQFQPHDAC